MAVQDTASFLDPVIIFAPQIQALAAFYQQGLELPAPEKFGDDHLGIRMQAVYLGFDRAEQSMERQRAGISL